jgi:hypothetical protein
MTNKLCPAAAALLTGTLLWAPATRASVIDLLSGFVGISSAGDLGSALDAIKGHSGSFLGSLVESYTAGPPPRGSLNLAGNTAILTYRNPDGDTFTQTWQTHSLQSGAAQGSSPSNLPITGTPGDPGSVSAPAGAAIACDGCADSGSPGADPGSAASNGAGPTQTSSTGPDPLVATAAFNSAAGDGVTFSDTTEFVTGSATTTTVPDAPVQPAADPIDVAEPGTLAVLGGALFGLGWFGRHPRRAGLRG